jgi:hypothetical protein
MMKRLFLTLLSFALLSIFSNPCLASKRVALVIGNGNYQHAPRLRNPANDAGAVGAALKRLDFDVEIGLDLTKSQTDEYVQRFGDRLMGAQVGLFYYAGHGLQVEGENYIAPVDARLLRERDLIYQAIPLENVLLEMEVVQRVNVVILDACRDNPLAEQLARNLRSRGRSGAVGRGLASIRATTGTLISYATKDGTIALDGSGHHSPYTKALLEHMETPGLEVGLMLRRVREKVMAVTNKKQVPWEYGSLIGEFYFAGQKPGGSFFQPGAKGSDREVVFWQSIEDSELASDFEEYLKRFPDGTFSGLARNRLKSLTAEISPKKPNVQPGESGPREIARDGRFIAYANGTVLDTRTNLMRAAKDNGYDINWGDARRYCESYRGGGYTDWRMPTMDELRGLYDSNKQTRYNVTGLIELSEYWVWASEGRGSDAAIFSFRIGSGYWYPQFFVRIYRVLPVRSGK